MIFRKTALAAATTLALLTLSHPAAAAGIESVEFLGMPAPATDDEKTDIYTRAQMRVTYSDDSVRTFPLKYHLLMGTTDVIRKQVVGGLYDVYDYPLSDIDGQLASDAPDANSLMVIPGMTSTKNPQRYNALALVTQYEYKELPPAGLTGSFWGKLPATMSLASLNQSKATGALSVDRYTPISFAAANGLWIPCAGSLSPWNTHLGSEEYEPDAKTREGLPKDADSDDGTDIDSFSQYYFYDAAQANAYHYGLLPEVAVSADGTTEVTKHYALGRFAREVADMLPDQRTAYMGDDGKNVGLFMFVADEKGDLSAGRLYAAKWLQTSNVNGGAADLQWIYLGHASDAEIKAKVDAGISFSDIFDVSNDDPLDPSYTAVSTYNGTEWLRLKPGMEQAAAFLETRRYAALLGATTEFSKMEGVSHDPSSGRGYNAKAYVVISRLEKGMADTTGDIRLTRNDGGAIYELMLRGNISDTSGNPIPSRYVAKNMASVPELLGGWPLSYETDMTDGDVDGYDVEGNRCEQDKVCGGDNIKFSPATRTLFVGEDTSRRNNNYVWAFNVDTRKLSRVLSVPRAAEATGLQVVENANGYAYIMSNFQHPGEAEQMVNPGDDVLLELLNLKWNDRRRSAIGYIGTEVNGKPAALPALK